MENIKIPVSSFSKSKKSFVVVQKVKFKWFTMYLPKLKVLFSVPSQSSFFGSELNSLVSVCITLMHANSWTHILINADCGTYVLHAFSHEVHTAKSLCVLT